MPTLIGSVPDSTHSTLRKVMSCRMHCRMRLGELDGKLGRDADILGDAAIGIVAFVGQQAELVLPARHAASAAS